ncbi:hypothetical protein LTR10_016683 [Elasticomyces elasticus]|uniref:Phosphatidate phosphatase APP1 catalytic domain-containing protein n=1 Tax=Exophiala sideris TaxID=1016849 RepID=A0ABR0JQK7_9EURO|nr:hypothetical protein LTR10_016683 [Elasticomyces elasticus]KAK5039876.1 hypothetical protein LTS07_000371 [Exophiala sideris]KAK5041428.1 hypothetical protein LTR13_002903 [Exophiala sideris]KAK5068255.1 hypothetical protein LTR69_000373 [Exophiala sideris]KAK5187556.1 hypothetical protein LTR44_000372 [Eurotiomycetes sp. CCFEE 6388]
MDILALLLPVLFILRAHAIPTEVTREEKALITPAPTRTLAVVYGDHHALKRGVVSDITSDITSELDSYLSSIFSGLGTAIPSYVSNGLLPNLENLPTGSAVASSVGVNSSDLAAIPTQVLNVPGYGNWTNNGWSLRIHGNVFKQPNVSNATIDKLADGFLIGTSMANLTASEQDQTRNVTREIYVVQQGNQSVTMDIFPGPEAGSSGQPGGGGGVTPSGGEQTITLPDLTTPEGDFDIFVPISNTSLALTAGTGDIAPQRLNVYAQGTDTGNATSYLVSDQGFTIISDIDDILRVTKIYEPAQGILNTFARPFTPWLNMPDIYANWSTSIPNMHFHYLTTTPEEITRNYMNFIYATYPGGSFDTRPLNFSDVSATLSIRKFLLDKIFQTFPNRKFILVADTSNSDVMRDYPEMATDFPGQVQCIFLRNTSSTDSGDKFPYNTDGFKDLNQSSYMFFNVPDDLTNLDIVNGQCYNSSIPQNLTFGYQGLPFDINLGSGSSSNSSSKSAATRSSRVGSFIVLVAGVLAFNIV